MNTEGRSFIKILNLCGTYVDIDALIVATKPAGTPVPAGTYQNTDTNLWFGGNWTQYNSSSASGGSSAYSEKIGDSVELEIDSNSDNGKQIQLLYTGLSNRGNMEVYIDDTLVDTINQYSSTTTWQNAWYSPVWKDNDPHTIRLVHASGQIADMDAIIFHDDIEIMGEGTYDNTDTRVFCDGSWVNYPLTNAYQGSTLYSETVGNTASFLFNGRQLSLLYTGYYTRGEMLIQIDGQTIDLLNQFTLDVTYQNRWDGPVLSPGEHTVTLTHSSGQVVDLDAIIISNADPLPAGTYDDDHEDVQYSGDWTKYTNASAHTGASRYSDTIGDTVNFSFTGTRLSLLYTGLTNRGNMQVYIDGTLEDTINQYTASTTWQNRWDSDEFTPGLHTVRLRHASGLINDLDGILIDGVNPLPAGTHDDTDSRIHFGGNWTAYSHANAHDGGSRYSESVGDTVSFYFTGTQLSLLYTALTNRGNMQVYIDGTLVGTINQYSSTLTWQKRWDSPTLSPGQHKVRLVHASGAINDLDAIIVTDSTATATPTATPTATITGTLTVSVTPGTTPIPTETPPPPLQEASYTYDGDGNMVKGVVNGVETYYPGRHYNEEVDDSTSTVKKFYTMGSATIAVRTISGTDDVLNWILGDHLGSTSVTANVDGSWNSEIKYTAFGEVRASNGLTPTEYRYTGQLEAAELGLYFYVARWYDPYLNQSSNRIRSYRSQPTRRTGTAMLIPIITRLISLIQLVT
jgi:hypothetical protein